MSRRALVAGSLLAGMQTRVYSEESSLMTWRDSEGATHPVRNRVQWSVKRRQILDGMQQAMGPLPGHELRCPLEVKVVDERPYDGMVLRRITYQSAPGERVPAYLLFRPGSARGPALLALHQTVAIGKDEPVGLGANPNRRYGVEPARRGFVVLASDYPTFGEHHWELGGRWSSGSMKAIWDNIRGVDLLQALPEVDPERIGVIGHSLGGHNALFTAAFDQRLRAAVSSCGFTAFKHYYGGDLKGWTSDRYMPRIRTEFPTPDRMPFDFDGVIAAIAPRGCLAISPLHDANFEVEGVREVIAACRPVYRLLGSSDALQVRYPDCAHDFPPPEREAAYRFLEEKLEQS